MSPNVFKQAMSRLRCGGQEEEKQYEPAFDGPPEKPEYYILAQKKGASIPHSKLPITAFMIEDRERHAAIKRARMQADPHAHPELGTDLMKIVDPYEKHDEILRPEHVPTYDVYKKDVPLKYFPIQYVHPPVSGRCTLETVAPEWKEAIERAAPGECQFFPYEYRLQDGTVLYKRWSMRCLNPAFGFSPMKCGFRRYRLAHLMTWDFGKATRREGEKTNLFQKKLFGGQLVLTRSSLRGRNILTNGYRDHVVSAALRDALKAHCGDYADFYPVHVDDER